MSRAPLWRRDAPPSASADGLAVHAPGAPSSSACAPGCAEPQGSTHDILVHPAANPPVDRFRAAMRDTQFRKTWDRQIKSLEGALQHEYDLALASLCVHMGWDDQGIVDLSIAHRRSGGAEARDLAYYLHLVQKARLEQSWEAYAELDPVHNELPDEQDGATRQRILRYLSERLKIQILRIEKLLLDEPIWVIVLVDGRRIEIGRVEAVWSQRAFSIAMFEALDRVFPRLPSAGWIKIVALLGRVAVPVDFGPDSAQGSLIDGWVGDYLSDHPALEDTMRAGAEKLPYRDSEGRVCIALSSFRRWIFHARGESIPRPKMALMMRAAGWEPWALTYVANGEKSTAGFWRRKGASDESPESRVGDHTVEIGDHASDSDYGAIQTTQEEAQVSTGAVIEAE